MISIKIWNSAKIEERWPIAIFDNDLFPIHIWEKYSIFQGGALHEQFRSCGGIFGGIGGAACLKLDQLFAFVSGNMMMMVIILMVIKMVVFTTFKDLFRDTSLDYIWRAQIPAQICQIWPNMPNMHIWVHIWAREIWSSGVSLKRSGKMQFKRVGLRSIGPSS